MGVSEGEKVGGGDRVAVHGSNAGKQPRSGTIKRRAVSSSI